MLASARFVTAFLALVLCACAADLAPSSETVNIVDPPASAPVITLDAAMLEAAPQLNLQELFRIDGESNPDAKLSVVGDMAFSGDTALAVVEAQLAQVLVYDTTGRLVRCFGGKGGGPGEFRGAGAMTTSGDTIFVVDMITVRRLTLDGTYIDGFEIDNAVTVDGRPGARAATGMLAHTPAGLVGYFSVPSPRRVSGEGVERDSMLVQVIEQPSGKVRTIVSIQKPDNYTNGSFGVSAWYVNRPRVAVSSGGTIFVTRASNTSIDVFDLAGSHQRRIALQPERRKVTTSAVDEVLARSDSIDDAMVKRSAVRGAGGEHTGSASMADIVTENRRFKRTIPHSEFHPVTGRILASEKGELLVERADLSQGSGEWFGRSGPTTWDLLTSDGMIAGRLEFPDRFTPKAMRNRVVAGEQKDGNDVPSIVAYRIG